MILMATQVSQLHGAEAVNFERQSVTVALTQEPPNLNGTRATDLVSFFVLGHTTEGLVRYDQRGNLVPGVAESWEITDKQMVFQLRPDARWHNGDPVTAHDFVFAWRLMVDPVEAAPYAAILYPIKNAEKIQKGELPVASLGIRAESDSKLVVSLESPCGYCLSLMVHLSFYPIQEMFYSAQGNKFGAEAVNILSNGPFMLSEWAHGVSLKMVKNPQYWDAANIKLNEINVGYITEDNRTRLNLFRTGDLALARLGAETVKDALSQGLRLKTFVSGGMSFIRFNMREGRYTAHPEIRQALQRVFDTEEFVNRVIAIPGYKPAHSLFPSWVKGVDDTFIAENPPVIIERNEADARQLINQLEQRLGTPVPALTMLTVTSPTGVKIAEYFQGIMEQKLGVRIKVDQQVFKQYIDKTQRGDYDLSLGSWYPDFDDIVTYADLLASWNPNNRGGYINPEYDRWLRVLQSEPDTVLRMAAAAQLQTIITNDVPLLPMAETGSAYVQHPKLRGVVRRTLGMDPDYTYARVLP